VKQHAYRNTWRRRLAAALGWRFVAWVLFWLLTISVLVNINFMMYLAVMP